MTIFIGLDVGRAGKDSTGLTVIERTGGKLRVIVSAVVLDMVFPIVVDLCIVKIILNLLLRY